MPKDQNLLNFLKGRNKEEGKYYVDLTSVLAIKLADVLKILDDIKNIKETCNVLIRLEEDKSLLSPLPFSDQQKILIRLGLWSYIVVGYAKCFADASKSTGRTKLDKKDYLTNLEQPLLDLHERILETRHTYFAHNSENAHEEIFTRLYLTSIEETDETIASLAYFGIRQISASPEDLKNTIVLLDSISTRLQKKMDKLSDKVLEEVSNTPFEQILPNIIKG